MTASDRLIDQLVGELLPVRRTSSARLVALVGLLAAAQGAIAFALGEVRTDLANGELSAILLWRIIASATLAGLAATAAIRLRSPLQSTSGWPTAALSVALAVVAAGWALDLVHPSPLPLLVRLRPMAGLHCVAVVIANGLPVLGLIAVMLRRGATVRPAAASAWAGLAAASTGGLVWALACPIDDPVYATLWYAIGFALLTAMARWLLPSTIKLRPPFRALRLD